MTLSMKIKGHKALTANMRKKHAQLKDRKTVNSNAVVVVDRWIQENFQTQGANVGGWKPLSDSTKFGTSSRSTLLGLSSKRVSRGGESAKILQDTGALRLKWNHIVSDKEATIESLAKSKDGFYYGMAHNEGGKNNKPPKRQILPDPRMVWPELALVYRKFLKKAIK